MNARGAPWWDPVLDQKDPSIIYIYAGQGGGTASWGSYDRCTPVARLREPLLFVYYEPLVVAWVRSATKSSANCRCHCADSRCPVDGAYPS